MTPRPDGPKAWAEAVDNIATMDHKDVEEAAFMEKTDEEKKLVRKIDIFLMPTIWILYCFSYMVCDAAVYLTSKSVILYRTAPILGMPKSQA